MRGSSSGYSKYLPLGMPLWILFALSLPMCALAVRRLPEDLTRVHVKNAIVDGMMVKDNEDVNQHGRKLTDEKWHRSLGKQKKSEPAKMPIAEDHLVTSLPYLDPSTFPTKHYAGHIPASKNDDKKLFYWLFEPDTSTVQKEDGEIPLLIWLNGGPGCSSMDGLWLENGPLRLVSPSVSGAPDWTIQINPYSWHNSPAYVLYVDQPVGTGLSFTKSKTYCKNDLEVDIDFHLFLENFLLVHQEHFLNVDKNALGQHTMKRPLYFSGESHAGHYIPSMMDHILKQNDDSNPATQPRVIVDLVGAAIGNGWTDPYYQYAGAEAAYGVGMIDLAQKEALDADEISCQTQLANGKYNSIVCDKLLNSVVSGSHGKDGQTHVSMYDNRKWETTGESRTFPLGHKDVERYLGGWTGDRYPKNMNVDYKEVLKAIHAEESLVAKQKYEECTDPPYYALTHQDGLGVVDEVVRILEHETKPRMLFFNGVNDMICNHVGNERLLQNLPWAQREDWITSKRYAWDALPSMAHLGPSGYMKEFDNLLFLKVMASGHMVPMDVPDVALEMMRTFMFSGSFDTSYQNMHGVIPSPSTCDCSGDGDTDAKECECPGCAETICECPTCDSQPQQNSMPQDSEGGDDNDIHEDQKGTSKIEGKREAFVGLVIGVLCTICFVRIRERRRFRKEPSFHDNDMEALQSPDRYTDNPSEMEMVAS